MNLRFKILSGFLALTLMLFLAGAWSIYILNTTGTSAHSLLEDNYKSINAANVMLEVLEREDSGILLLMLGNWDEGRSIMAAADSLFWAGFNTASGNLTIPGEQVHLDSIRTRYRIFQSLWEKPIVSTAKERNVDWYFAEIHTAFLDCKTSVNHLREMNSKTMYQTSTHLKNRTKRAIMPGIIAMIAALIFALLFNFFINYYVVQPVSRINKAIREYLDNGTPVEVEVETHDEIGELRELVLTIIHRTR
ncbi:MAG: hypothetical protein R3C26_24680 [Calditrichia bacterium]